ncbi:MAG: hypothetical protein QNJ54_37955 [Prochloraceae cyanobacterium]|nr:hypothetical protein [Prochloraceae cyanobacterium]
MPKILSLCYLLSVIDNVSELPNFLAMVDKKKKKKKKTTTPAAQRDTGSASGTIVGLKRSSESDPNASSTASTFSDSNDSKSERSTLTSPKETERTFVAISSPPINEQAENIQGSSRSSTTPLQEPHSSAPTSSTDNGAVARDADTLIEPLPRIQFGGFRLGVNTNF